MATLLGELADDLVAVLQQPATQAQLQAAIAAGELSLEALVTAGIKNLPKPGGVLGIIFPAIENALENYIGQILAKYTAPEILTWLTNLAVDEAKNLGG